jgi:hypothetical protein
MTTLLVQPAGRPGTARDARVLDGALDRATEQLAGRTVWSATALPESAPDARALTECLRWAGGRGVEARALPVDADEPLRALAAQLQQMLDGTGGRVPLGASDEDVFATGVRDGDALVGPDVGQGDVVVLHDALTAALAEDVRERGAHAVWRVPAAPAPSDAAGTDAWSFLRAHTPAVDAILMTWFQPDARGFLVERVAALMPSADVVAAKEIAPAPPARATPPFEDAAWSTLLADVVAGDRGERVGGRRHARPGVPAR